MSFVDNTIDFLWQNFLSPEFGVSEGSSLIFGDTQIALQHKSGTGGRNPPCQNQLDSSSHFDTTPACNRLTDGQMRDNSKYCARGSAGSVKNDASGCSWFRVSTLNLLLWFH